MRDLTEIRQEIDGIDTEMVRLLEERLQLVQQVAEYKLANGKPVLDKQREKEKLDKLEGIPEESFSQKSVRELFEQIMAICRKRQYQLINQAGGATEPEFKIVKELDYSKARIVYQGVEGAYSQMAMNAFFGDNPSAFHVETWREAMEAISTGTADYAVLPIENSSAGIVSENYDLLVEYNSYIIGEQTIKIQHALLGLPGTKLSDISSIYSHPQALMQCVDYLDQHKDWERISVKNTAMAAKKVLEDGDKHQAAIANPITAKLYDLEVLASAINYSADNSTRFIIVTGQKVFRQDASKISICFEIPHESGSLYQALSHFIFNDLNMNKIESRPIKDKSFEYRFFVDFEGNLMDGAVQNALTGLREEVLNLQILGNY